jgi:hypothetical protein
MSHAQSIIHFPESATEYSCAIAAKLKSMPKMPKKQDNDEVFLECMKKIRAEKKKWKAADASGDKKAKRQADENISAYTAGASENVPSFAPSPKSMQNTLSSGSDLFATRGNDKKKKDFLDQISPLLLFCSQLKTAGGLAAAGGLVALGCLADHRPWLMTNGSISEVTQIPGHDGTTSTLAWDANHNGILDHQETINNLSGQVVEGPHAITGGDVASDVVDAATQAVSGFWEFIRDGLFS